MAFPHLQPATIQKCICSDVEGYDSSVRAVAFEILLKSAPSKETVSRLLEVVASVGGEFASYCLNRVKEYSASDPHLRAVLGDGVNWGLQSLATGFSTTFSRMLAETRYTKRVMRVALL